MVPSSCTGTKLGSAAASAMVSDKGRLLKQNENKQRNGSVPNNELNSDMKIINLLIKLIIHINFINNSHFVERSLSVNN